MREFTMLPLSGRAFGFELRASTYSKETTGHPSCSSTKTVPWSIRKAAPKLSGDLGFEKSGGNQTFLISLITC